MLAMLSYSTTDFSHKRHAEEGEFAFCKRPRVEEEDESFCENDTTTSSLSTVRVMHKESSLDESTCEPFRESPSGVSLSSTHTECSEGNNDASNLARKPLAMSTDSTDYLASNTLNESNTAGAVCMDVTTEQVDFLVGKMCDWSITNMKALRRNNIYDTKLRHQQVEAARREVIRVMQRSPRSSGQK
jgi:hypothetical protein